MNRPTTLSLLLAASLLALLGGCGRRAEPEEAQQAVVPSDPDAELASDGAGDTEASALAPDSTEATLVSRARQPFSGDLGELRQRRFVRVLVSYSKTNFFHDGEPAVIEE